VPVAAFSLCKREATKIAAGIDERRDVKETTGVNFICDRKGMNRGRGERNPGRKRDERKDGVSKSQQRREHKIKKKEKNNI
jgi:hypothetical protein